MTINKGSEYFNVVTYAGNSSTNAITGVGFQPDFVWIKNRSDTQNHVLVNSVTDGYLYSNTTDAEDAATDFTFDADGFTHTGGSARRNATGSNYVAWCWKAGGTAVTNNDGTIESQVSANPTSGFSIVTYTGNGTNGASVGHGLGVKPAFIITKKRSTGTTDFGWSCWHKDLGGTSAGIWLHLTNIRNNNMWTDSHTTTTFRPADVDYNNVSGQTYVNYLFAPVAGFSAFGSYIGNNSTNGPFVYTGFRPRFIMYKVTSVDTDNWFMHDTKRITTNTDNFPLLPNQNFADTNDYYNTNIDVLSNGFKVRNTRSNVNTAVYIYMAFAENPFKVANAR